MTPPTVVCVIGKKKSGKTTVASALIRALSQRGRRVSAAKHGHGFRLDHPGTDSWTHRESGAERVAVVGPEQMALLGAWGPGGERSLEEVVAAYLGDAEIVVAEGFKTSSFPKIEVFRRAAHPEPVWPTLRPPADQLVAVVTDDELLDPSGDWGAPPTPVLAYGDDATAGRLADLVEARRAV